MSTAFVLINVRPGEYSETLLNRLKAIEGVTEAYAVYGVYDIVLKASANSMDALKELIFKRIRKVKDVQSTLTMMMFEEQAKFARASR